MIAEIIELLQKLCDAYDSLYSFSTQKKEKIIANDADAVNEIVQEEWSLLNEVTELEDKRSAKAAELFAGKLDHAATVEDLMAAATPEEKAKLEEISGKLKETIDKLKESNAENRALIELHLEYVEYMVNTVLKEPQLSNIYGNSGRETETSALNKGIIDNEA